MGQARADMRPAGEKHRRRRTRAKKGVATDTIRTRGDELVTQDPATELSPTARRILAAARRVLARDGFAGLSLEAIAAEAGENKASIRYHFGNKAGLITALVDLVVHDENVQLLRDLSKTGDDRIDVLMNMHRRTTANAAGYRLFFDLFPNVIRDATLWPRMAELYRWYRELDAVALAPGADDALRARVEVLTSLTVAVCDGLAMQHLSDPEFDLAPGFELYEHLVREALTEIGVAVEGVPAAEPAEETGAPAAPKDAAKDGGVGKARGKKAG
jgi:AcrR family transcriptional regulator